jgi:hypothetical protein
MRLIDNKEDIMAKVERGSFTVTSTGNKIYSLVDTTLVPNRVAFSVVTGSEITTGYSDGTKNFCGTSAYNEVSSTKPISHYRNIGGTKTKTLEGTYTGSAAGEFYMNFSTRTENTTVRFVAYED